MEGSEIARMKECYVELRCGREDVLPDVWACIFMWLFEVNTVYEFVERCEKSGGSSFYWTGKFTDGKYIQGTFIDLKIQFRGEFVMDEYRCFDVDIKHFIEFLKLTRHLDYHRIYQYKEWVDLCKTFCFMKEKKVYKKIGSFIHDDMDTDNITVITCSTFYSDDQAWVITDIDSVVRELERVVELIHLGNTVCNTHATSIMNVEDTPNLITNTNSNML